LEHQIGESMTDPLEPLKDELDIGQMAAETLVQHVKNMNNARSCHLEVPDGDGVWVVEVKFEKGKSSEKQ
jgi:hypothetical protein